MTTIAYHHGDKQIAIDSRVTSSGVVITDSYCKIIKRNNRTFFMSGLCADYDRFINEFEDGAGTVELECFCLMIHKGKGYRITQEGNRYLTSELTYCDAIGSGWQFAMAAMDFGKSAKEAVQYASKRDIYTGGKIKVYNL